MNREVKAKDTLAVPSKSSVHRAGSILRKQNDEARLFYNAIDTLSAWRALHSYPIRTFRAYLEKHLKRNRYENPIIAQRLKRLPSIIQKLQRFPGMGLETMQDIGGIRVILKNCQELNQLYAAMRRARFEHRPLLPPADYIKEPKPDGYRSLHQVYGYASKTHPELNVLHIELQLRTRLQHAWATAVETLGIIEKSSFKTGEGSDQFKTFFKLSSAIFSHEEKLDVLAEYRDMTFAELKKDFLRLENELQIFAKLKGLAISARHIESTSKDSDGYHLMTLDIARGRISLIPFLDSQLEDAEFLYREKEKETRDDPNMAIVLISAGNVKEIKRAYPNYFLDTNDFIKNLQRITGQHNKAGE